MQIEYILRKEDFLNFQLYYASKDETINKQRRRSHFFVVIIPILFGAISLMSNDRFAGFYFLGGAVLVLFLYPWYSSWLYKRNYSRLVDSRYSGQINTKVSLTLGQEYLTLERENHQSQYKTSALASLVETSAYFFVQTMQSLYIIIPKDQLEDANGIHQQLLRYSTLFDIPYHDETLWKWK